MRISTLAVAVAMAFGLAACGEDVDRDRTSTAPGATAPSSSAQTPPPATPPSSTAPSGAASGGASGTSSTATSEDPEKKKD